MLFNSIQFLVFFAFVTSFYFALPHRFRWPLLLAASCYFYMAFIPIYILILAFTIVIDYFAGLLIEGAEGRKRKLFLVMSLVANIGVLAFFKYYNFLNGSLTQLTSWLHVPYPVPFLSIILPIGLSFHTFQAMSYTIEVYRKHHPAERHFGIYALYVMYYPQLVAGPIERPGNLLHQFHAEHRFDYARVTDGLRLMLWGFFKKVVVADRLSPFVNRVYDHPSAYQGLPLVIATVFFAFQIYADFSGYSDIAIGASQVMGIRLMKNFDRPYFSKSIAEFWKRWHISLSSWFRDYLYISLGGSRVAAPRWLLNLLLTFLISGLWHGARWTFVIWGGLNGIYLIGEIGAAALARRSRAAAALGGALFGAPAARVALTFGLTCFAWIFFRANSTADAFHIAGHMFSGMGDSLRHLGDREYLKANILLGQDRTHFALAVCAIVALLAAHLVQRRGSVRARLLAWPVPVRWACYYAIVIGILFFGAFNQSRQFIYFQF